MIPDDQNTAIIADLALWTTALTAHKTAATHNTITIEAMRMQYAISNKLVADLRQQIKRSTVELPAADYENLGIHSDKTTRTPAPIPMVSPTNTLLASNHLVNRISTAESNQGDENHRSKPLGVQRVGRKIALVAQGATAPVAADYHAIDSVGSIIFDIVFNPLEVDMNCYLITWYINSRGEAEPESPPLMFIVV